MHVIYRPPYSEKHRVTTATCLTNLNYLSKAVQTTHSLVIAGDLNIHMETDTGADKIRMCDVLSICDLTQHVTVSMHVSGHTLYVIISRHNSEFLLSCPTTDYIVSDHMFVLYRIN